MVHADFRSLVPPIMNAQHIVELVRFHEFLWHLRAVSNFPSRLESLSYHQSRLLIVFQSNFLS
jgi:hypothetical protein